ncbi:MAG: HU family DNA-binding protein, partial [Muribaculaceae bacterium]|nr:HU family DNA-binding protein [Muribaculaceae bacterium]
MNNKISVRQFAEKLASECGISPEDAQQYVKLYFDKVIECLRSGENVELPGLGKFSLTRQTDC